MKITTLLWTFLFTPVLVFAQSQNTGNFSYFKMIGGFTGTMILIVMTANFLRFGGKRYLLALHSRQHPIFKKLAQKIIRYHNQFAIIGFLLTIIHGIAFYIPKMLLDTRMLLGMISLFLFALTSYFGFLINKKPLQRQLFYRLHMIVFVLLLVTGVVHIQYKLFSKIFLL